MFNPRSPKEGRNSTLAGIMASPLALVSVSVETQPTSRKATLLSVDPLVPNSVSLSAHSETLGQRLEWS